MTLTAPGCPSSGYISDQVKQRLLRMPGVNNATVEIVWYPQWTPERLSAEARKHWVSTDDFFSPASKRLLMSNTARIIQLVLLVVIVAAGVRFYL